MSMPQHALEQAPLTAQMHVPIQCGINLMVPLIVKRDQGLSQYLLVHHTFSVTS